MPRPSDEGCGLPGPGQFGSRLLARCEASGHFYAPCLASPSRNRRPSNEALPTRPRVAKVRPEKEPKLAPSIPDLWEAFDVVWGFGEPVEAEPASEAKP